MTVKRCANCEHPVYRHDPDGEERCGISGCPCPGFLTPVVGRPTSAEKRAIEMVRFAHHDHAFGDEYCNPQNCSVAAFLAEYDPVPTRERAEGDET